MSKIGEIFQIDSLSPNRYFQLVAIDETQLNSDVIAVFSPIDAATEETVGAEISEVTKSGVEFFTHTTVSVGVRDKLWKKVGSATVIDYSDALFKEIDMRKGFPEWQAYERDYYHSWIIWKVNGEWQEVGSDIDQYPNAELGAVYPPKSTLYRIEHGRYEYPYYGQLH